MALAASRQQQASRPRLLQAVFDAVQQPDIRKKLLFTGALLVVFRFIAHIPIPNVDPRALEDAFDQNNLLNLFNLFSGGALRQLSIASLGVYPYITASIIMTLVTPMMPSLQAMREEGEQGRNRIELYQHWMTVPLAFIQGYAQLVILEQQVQGTGALRFSPGFSGDDALPTITALFAMTAGTLFLVWMGELITENGIGNGISVIIFGGIVAGMPGLVSRLFNSTIGLWGIGLLMVLSVLLVAAIVFMQEATRKIPVQYAKSVFRAGKMYRQSGQSHIPLRVNSAGMIPLIFAFSIVILPVTIAQFVLDSSSTGFVRDIANFFVNVLGPGTGQGGQGASPGFYVLVFVLVMLFSFFYTLVVFQQQNLAENLQKNGGFVPGIRPGKPTGEYIMRVLVRITWAGAIFLGVVAVIPYLVTNWFGITSLTISATGMLIVVGVVLDTMKQLEAQLLMRNYEGFIR
ncbi:MAG TPA: preprotein translocase subunit SecY [Dehalococcoidia bacterium]|jgi:preprotein translocase subunit SecY|nr:preprotein translocase subunit SecY [Dehalococcoidia bacterium]